MTTHRWGMYSKKYNQTYSEKLIDSFTFEISNEDILSESGTQLLWTKVENGQYVSYFLPEEYENTKWIRDSYYLGNNNIFYDRYNHFEGGKGYVNEFATNDYSPLTNAYKSDGLIPVYSSDFNFTGALSGKYKVSLGLRERHGNYSRNDYFTTKASVYELIRNTNYSKGSKIDTVTSTNRNAYPNDGASGSYWYVYEGIANQTPTISGQDEDLGGFKAPFKKVFSVDDPDSNETLNVTVKLNSATIRTINNATKGESYEIDIDKVKFDELELNKTNTIEITVSDSNGASAIRRYTFKKVNSNPVVTVTNSNLGEQNKPFNFSFKAADPDGDDITVKVYVDDVQLQDLGKVTPNQSKTVSIGKLDYAKLLNGEHRIKIEATDSFGAKGTGYITFTKKIDYCWYRLTKEVDAQPTAVVVNPLTELAKGAKMTVKVSLNSKDKNPTWEVVPEELIGQKYNFKTKSKTADKWCIGVDIRIDRADTPEGMESYFYGFVGAYM